MSAYVVGTLYTCNGCKYLDFKNKKCLQSNIVINRFVDCDGYETLFKPKQCKGYAKNDYKKNIKKKDRGKGMATTNTLKEAMNQVTIIGYVKEKNLEIKKTTDGQSYITGTLTIQTGENDSHKVFAYAKEYTKNNEVSKVYTGLKTVMEEYISKANLLQANPEMTSEEAELKATKVKVSGKLGRQEYYRNNEFISYPQISSNFFNRINDESEYTPKAEFNVVMYYDKITSEIKNDEETGRIKVMGYIPIYNGTVIPMEFVADGETGEYILDNYETKKTGEIWGDLISTAVTTVERKSGFGKEQVSTHTTYVNEMRITGGDEYQYDEDSPKSYKVEDIKHGCQIRETEYLPSLLQKSQEKNHNNKNNNSVMTEAKKSFSANW